MVIVHVININSVVGLRTGFNIDEWLGYEIDDACRRLSGMVEYLSGEGVKAKFVCPIPVGDPTTEIVNASRREDVDAIVMGARGRSVDKDVLLGSVAEGVIRKSNVPVVIVKGRLKFDRILFAHDLSDRAWSLLRSLDSKIVVIHVSEKLSEAVARSKLAPLRSYDGKIDDVIVRSGVPSKEILRCEREKNVDAIVLCGYGITADTVIRHSYSSIIYFPTPGSI